MGEGEPIAPLRPHPHPGPGPGPGPCRTVLNGGVLSLVDLGGSTGGTYYGGLSTCTNRATGLGARGRERGTIFHLLTSFVGVGTAEGTSMGLRILPTSWMAWMLWSLKFLV